MKIQIGKVSYNGRDDYRVVYGTTDDNRAYYFLDNSVLPNNARIGSKDLREAIDNTVKPCQIGLVSNDGKEIIPFDNKMIKVIGDGILLVEASTPKSKNVIDTIALKSDPKAATKLVATPATIKDKMAKVMSRDARYVFNDLFSEAYICDLNGKKLVDGSYSFIAVDSSTNKIYMNTNNPDDKIVEYSIINSKVESNDSRDLDVTKTNIPVGVVEEALNKSAPTTAPSSVYTDSVVPSSSPVSNNNALDSYLNRDISNDKVETHTNTVSVVPPKDVVESVAPKEESDDKVDTSKENGVQSVVPKENVEVANNVSKDESTDKVDASKENNVQSVISLENVTSNDVNKVEENVSKEENKEVSNNNIQSVAPDENIVTNDVMNKTDENVSKEDDIVKRSEEKAIDIDKPEEVNGINVVSPAEVEREVNSKVEESDKPKEEIKSIFEDNHEEKNVNDLEDVKLNIGFDDSSKSDDNYELNDYSGVFNDSHIDNNRESNFYDVESDRDENKSDNIIEDVAKSMTELMKQNRKQKGLIVKYRDSLQKAERMHRTSVKREQEQNNMIKELSNKVRDLESSVTKYEARCQIFESKVQEQEALINSQERELERIRPQLEGKEELAKVLRDAKILLGKDNNNYDYNGSYRRSA